MGFQKTVTMTPGIGTPGSEVNVGQAVYTPFQYISDGTVAAGTFAFAVDLEEGASEYAMNSASAKGSAGDKPLGFVERNVIGIITDVTKEGTEVYAKGQGLAIAQRGQFYAVAAAAATEGQSVLCDPTTGTITYGAAAATNDTGWVVRLPRGVVEVAKGDIVIYENLGVGITPASGGVGG